MEANSKEIESSQAGVHPRLEEYVTKHLKSAYNKPLHSFSEGVFKEITETVNVSGKPVILDSGCGTGESTRILAELHPDCFVVGIDKSEHRISKTENLKGENYLIIQADLVDFWRQAVDAGWKLYKHYLLYPNPWPKAEHLKRRWHGHPVFPYLIKLGGGIELRTNWKTYADEFKLALKLAGLSPLIEELNQSEPITLFEKKYSESGHQLFRVTV